MNSSPLFLAATAMHTAAALDLIETGANDEVIERALDAGIEFCKLIELGVAALNADTFSAASLEAERAAIAINTVQHTFAKDAAFIRADVEAVLENLRNKTPVDSEFTSALRERFFNLAVHLTATLR